MKAIAGAYLAAVAATVIGCVSMSAMPGMDMPGGWTMSMMWMRMPGQTWPGAAAEFIGMWSVMMVAMMLPVVMPRLLAYRRRLHDRAGANVLAASFAYFAVWTLLGALVYPVGVAFAELTMRIPALASAVPSLTAICIAAAGVMQLTPWKQRTLAACRATQDCCAPPAAPRSAWLEGTRLGWQCVQCCSNFTALLLVLGVMDLRAMLLVTGCIAIERLAPAGERWARGIGVVLIASAFWVMATSG